MSSLKGRWLQCENPFLGDLQEMRNITNKWKIYSLLVVNWWALEQPIGCVAVRNSVWIFIIKFQWFNGFSNFEKTSISSWGRDTCSGSEWFSSDLKDPNQSLFCKTSKKSLCQVVAAVWYHDCSWYCSRKYSWYCRSNLLGAFISFRFFTPYILIYGWILFWVRGSRFYVVRVESL